MTTPTGQQSPLEELGVSYVHVSTLSPTNITSLKEAFFENLPQCILGENWGISTMLNSTGGDISGKCTEIDWTNTQL